jgi:hypothetical protein
MMNYQAREKYEIETKKKKEKKGEQNTQSLPVIHCPLYMYLRIVTDNK